jgi:hypothetical protein
MHSKFITGISVFCVTILVEKWSASLQYLMMYSQLRVTDYVKSKLTQYRSQHSYIYYTVQFVCLICRSCDRAS